MIAEGSPSELMRSETLEHIYGIPMGSCLIPRAAPVKLCLLMLNSTLLEPPSPADGHGTTPLLLKMNLARAAAVDPHRIVALEWLPVELMMALGVTPYGGRYSQLPAVGERAGATRFGH